MKNYEKTFICTLPVQQLAEKLIETIHPDINVLMDEDKMDGKLFNEMKNKNEFFTNLTESIIDAIENNGDACANLFSVLNGWVYKGVPIKAQFNAFMKDLEDTSEDEDGAIIIEIAKLTDKYIKIRLKRYKAELEGLIKVNNDTSKDFSKDIEKHQTYIRLLEKERDRRKGKDTSEDGAIVYTT